jgi:glycine/sarcosine N-methyltransferase
MEFYNHIASQYDNMTGFQARLERASAFAGQLAQRLAFRSVLDVACGTGLYALAFAKQGVPKAAGCDINTAMLAMAQQRSQEVMLGVDWFPAPMQHLAEHTNDCFDLILCLGNSLPHLLDDSDLAATFAAFRQRLTPGGHVVLQNLNYDRILSRQERIVEINRSGDREFVRFYDFLPGRVQFNLLTLHWQGDQCRHDLQTTALRPYTRQELTEALHQQQFTSITDFGGLDFSPFDPASSATLMVIAEKPAQ